jgi:hypothetical protein
MTAIDKLDRRIRALLQQCDSVSGQRGFVLIVSASTWPTLEQPQ